MRLALLLLALPLAAESYNVGGPATGAYLADTVCGGITFSVPGQAGVYSTLKYATSLSCDIPAPNGSCVATLDLIENRPAGPNPATDSAIGTRVFTVAANGTSFGSIDIFALVGALKPLVKPLPAVMVTDGHLRLAFVAQRGNAVLSGLEIACTPTPPPLTGVPCSSLVPANGIVLVITLPDGSCLPAKVLAAPGFLADTVETWTDADENGTVRAQVIYSLLTPVK